MTISTRQGRSARRMRGGFFALAVMCLLVGSTQTSGAEAMTTEAQFRAATTKQQNVTIQATPTIGGRCDVLGEGALLLAKQADDQPFYRTTPFKPTGRWTSRWFELERGNRLSAVGTTLWVYGRDTAMNEGWTKFAGNPLICPENWRHATEQSLLLPGPLDGWPNDQSLVRGAGRWEGQWLIVFNHGSWAKYGWGAAVADGLGPAKQERNPFTLVEPFPLVTGEQRQGKHAPNDWIYVEETGLWYAPDETGGKPSHMWTSPDLTEWTNRGPIQNMKGHDPGMVWDGEQFHLFNEDGHKITHMVADDALGAWEVTGSVLKVGGHTGDADVSFFNNRWHMFIDDHPHNHYKLGYAWTTPEQFPRGWRMTHHVYGPHNPEQNQQWDDDTKAGNRFGTGDADVAVDGDTLYLTHERPVGLAFKTLNVRDGEKQQVKLRVYGDADGDGEADKSTEWLTVKTGKQQLSLPDAFREKAWQQVRVEVKLHTDESAVSPMLRSLRLQTRQ